MTPGAVVVFARAPERGRVKTRLAPLLGDERTLALYRAFLADTMAAARASGAFVVLAHTPGRFEERALADAALEQVGESFAERFDRALAAAREHLGSGVPFVVVGADAPHLSPASLRDALGRLDRSGTVVGPSGEGGFYLLGFRDRVVPVGGVFAAPNDAAALLRLLAREGLGPELLPRVDDVDVPDDLVGLLFELELREAAGEWAPPATSKLLASWGARVERVADGNRGHRLRLDPG